MSLAVALEGPVSVYQKHNNGAKWSVIKYNSDMYVCTGTWQNGSSDNAEQEIKWMMAIERLVDIQFYTYF